MASNSEAADTAVVDVESEGSDPGPLRSRHKRTKGWNVLAILSFVAALVASPLAALFGYLAVGQIRRSDQRGIALAWIAVGLGWLWLSLLGVVLLAFGLIWFETPLWP